MRLRDLLQVTKYKGKTVVKFLQEIQSDSIDLSAWQNSDTPPFLPPKAPADNGNDAGNVVLERQRQKIAPPSMYQVVMLNDDYTPMEFVVLVIQSVFAKDIETATQIMLKIHVEGRAVCGVYTQDIATSKATQVMELAQSEGHPLQCISEPVA